MGLDHPHHFSNQAVGQFGRYPAVLAARDLNQFSFFREHIDLFADFASRYTANELASGEAFGSRFFCKSDDAFSAIAAKLAELAGGKRLSLCLVPGVGPEFRPLRWWLERLNPTPQDKSLSGETCDRGFEPKQSPPLSPGAISSKPRGITGLSLAGAKVNVILHFSGCCMREQFNPDDTALDILKRSAARKNHPAFDFVGTFS